MSSPTVRRRRLSYLLRELREASGYTAQHVTDTLGWSRGKLTHIEQNQWKRPNRRDIEDLLDIYEVTDPEKREATLALVKQARQRGWWVSYSDVWGAGTFVGLLDPYFRGARDPRPAPDRGVCPRRHPFGWHRRRRRG